MNEFIMSSSNIPMSTNVLNKNTKDKFNLLSKLRDLTSEYIIISQPKYIYLKLTPSTSIRNYNSDSIIKTLASLYRQFTHRITKANKQLKYEKIPKLAFYIYMEKSKVEFYFIVPEKHYYLFKEQIVSIWANKITIEQVDTIPTFSPNCTKYNLKYTESDIKTLYCDKRNNALLSNMFNILSIIQENDKLGMFYNFSPTDIKQWKLDYDRALVSLQNGNEPYCINNIDFKRIYSMALSFLSNMIDFVAEIVTDLLGGKKSNHTIQKKDLGLNPDSTKKRDAIIINAQLLCLSEADDKFREKDNAISLCSSFDILNYDNELTFSEVKSNKLWNKKANTINLLDTNLKGVYNLKMQPRECQNFISLPAKEILEEHNIIEHTNVRETILPDILKTGYIHLGTVKYKNVEEEAYTQDDKNVGNLPLILVAPQNAGKTTYIANYTAWCQSRNEGCIFFDYIRKNELTDAIIELGDKRIIDKNKIIVLDMSNVDDLQGIGYNEFTPLSNCPSDIVECANRKAQYLVDLLDAINENGEPLRPAMREFVIFVSTFMFSCKPDASLKDVVKLLTDYEYREKIVSSLDYHLKPELEDELSVLDKLNAKDKKTDKIIGNISNQTIEGVLSRISTLKSDYRLKKMFNKNTRNNIDLAKELREGKVIIIKLPQAVFSNSLSKNVVCTYMFTKIWIATLINGSLFDLPNRTHFICDEPFQVKTMLHLIDHTDVMPQLRKFFMRCVFTIQGTDQIKEINQTLLNGGASYMFLSGTTKVTYNFFKEELEPYTYEDIQNLKQYHSLNYIKTTQGYMKFVTRLPMPVVRVQK